MTTVHRVHTDTVQDQNGVWWIVLRLNGSPCGTLGPIAIEETADAIAKGVAEGLRIAFNGAQKR